MIQFDQGQSDESVRSFERSIGAAGSARSRPTWRRGRSAPISALAHHYLAQTLMKRGSPEEAIRSPASGDRASQGPRRGVSERVVVSRSTWRSSFSNLGCDPHAQRKESPRLSIRVRRANAIQRALVEEHPEDPQLRHTLALSTLGMASQPQYARPMEGEQATLPRVSGDHEPGRRREPGRHRVPGGSGDRARRVASTSSTTMRSTPGWSPSPRRAIKRRRSDRTNPNDVRNLNSLASIHRGIGKSLREAGEDCRCPRLAPSGHRPRRADRRRGQPFHL